MYPSVFLMSGQQDYASEFSPLTVPGLDPDTLFLDLWGQQGVTTSGVTSINNDAIDSATDGSGKGNTVLQAVAASKPTMSDVGGIRAFSFDGDDELVCDAPVGISTDPVTLFAAIKLAPGGERTILCIGPAAGGFEWSINASGQHRLAKANVAVMGTSTGTLADATWGIVAVRYNAGAITFFTDGINVGTATDLRSFTAGDLFFGARDGGEFFTGLIERGLGYAAAPTDAQVLYVSRGLGAEVGVTI